MIFSEADGPPEMRGNRMQIAVQIRNVYGEPKAYPANLQAECLAAVAGTKTLTLNTLRQALRMGCDIIDIGNPARVYRGASDTSCLPAIR